VREMIAVVDARVPLGSCSLSRSGGSAWMVCTGTVIVCVDRSPSWSDRNLRGVASWLQRQSRAFARRLIAYRARLKYRKWHRIVNIVVARLIIIHGTIDDDEEGQKLQSNYP